MGLDMYLFKTKRVEGISINEIGEIDNVLNNILSDYDEDLQLEEITGIENADLYFDAIKEVKIGESYSYYTIFEDIGYWRKANHIHKWFVDYDDYIFSYVGLKEYKH